MVRSAVLVLAAAVLFGTTGTARALGPPRLDPALVGAGRLVLGGAVLAGLAAAGGGLRTGRRWSRPALLVAAAGIAGYQLTFFGGVAAAGVAVGTLVTIGSAPVFTGLLGWLLAGQSRPGRAWLLATALALAGLVVLLLPGRSSTADPGGVLLAVGAAVSYATYTLAAKRLLDDGHPPTAVMGAAFGLAALLLLPVLAALHPAALLRPGALALVGYLALAPTVLAYLAFARGLAGLPPATVTTLGLAEPVVAAALGVLLLGEPLSAATAAGAALVLAGIAVAALATRGPSGRWDRVGRGPSPLAGEAPLPEVR